MILCMYLCKNVLIYLPVYIYLIIIMNNNQNLTPWLEELVKEIKQKIKENNDNKLSYDLVCKYQQLSNELLVYLDEKSEFFKSRMKLIEDREKYIEYYIE